MKRVPSLLQLLQDDEDEDEDTSSNDSSIRSSTSCSSLRSTTSTAATTDAVNEKNKERIWFGRQDFSKFAQQEMQRRGSLGITSTSALDSSVPQTDEHEEQPPQQEYSVPIRG